MMGGRWRRVGALVIGTALVTELLAGCATVIGGTATHRVGGGGSSQPGSGIPSSAQPARGGAAELLGMFSAIDPCSLTDPAVFSKFGTARFGVPDSLDECLVEVSAGAPEPVSVYVGQLDRTEAFPELRGKESATLPGGLRVVDYETGTSYCSKLLVFTDGVTMTVNASPYQGSEARLCELVSEGMDRAVEVIRAGAVRHREFPVNSLAWIDPCELVPADVVAAVPDLGATRPKGYPARHNCLWATEDAVNGPRLRVMFAAGLPPRVSGPGASEVYLAGRGSVVTPSSAGGSNVYCFVETGHVPMVVAGQPSVLEKAYVSVRLRQGQSDAACTAATLVASAVWARLPTP